MLDTYREVITPEGVGLHLPAAGPVPRALAWGIDLAIRLGVLMIMGMVLAMLGKVGEGLYLIGLFLVFWAYPIVLESVWHGQTPGKKALGLRVVSADGAPVGWSPAWRTRMRAAWATWWPVRWWCMPATSANTRRHPSTRCSCRRRACCRKSRARSWRSASARHN
jgi:uncharacterized RDD family membrane protein YckC